MTLFVAIVGIIAGTKFRRGSILSPFTLVLLILISIFGIRPLLMPDNPASFYMYGYNTASGFDKAALFGFIGTASFVAGYAFWSIVLRNKYEEKMAGAKPVPAALPDWAPDRSIKIAWCLFGSWFLVMIIIGGGVGFLSELFGGRSPAVMAKLANVPAVFSSLPVIGCLTIAAVRFQYERYAKYTQPQNLAYWLITAVSVIPPSAIGTRRFLIPSVVMAIIGALANSWTKKIKLSWVVGGVAAFFALAVIPFVRSSGSRDLGSTDLIGAMNAYFGQEGVRGVLDGFFLSYDTEMFNYVSYLSRAMGTIIPFGMGRGTLGEIIGLPIPAAISPFERWNDVLLMHMYGEVCDYQQACPVPSIVGILYSDLAMPGLIVGMLLLGIWAGRFEAKLFTATGTKMGVLMLTAGFAISFTRGNSMAQVWLAVQCFFVWWALDKFLLRPRKPRSAWESRHLPDVYRHLHERPQAAEVGPPPVSATQ